MKTLKAAVIGLVVVLGFVAVAVALTVGLQWFAVHPRAGGVVFLVGLWLTVTILARAAL